MISAAPEPGLELCGAGWFGKLPVLGDFASRRLPPEFIEAWDQWLSAGLAAWQAQDPRWLEAYLQAPSQRFLLPPGLLGATAWTGVLMPSVDQVGRYFPLTLALPCAALPASAEAAQALLDWLLRLDDLAVDALQDDWPIERLEAELQQLGTGLPARDDPPGALARQLHAASLAQPGAVLWLRRDAQGHDQLHASAGLPAAEALAALFAAAPVSMSPHHPTAGPTS